MSWACDATLPLSANGAPTRMSACAEPASSNPETATSPPAEKPVHHRHAPQPATHAMLITNFLIPDKPRLSRKIIGHFSR
jgi:hypothetical protein